MVQTAREGFGSMRGVYVRRASKWLCWIVFDVKHITFSLFFRVIPYRIGHFPQPQTPSSCIKRLPEPKPEKTQPHLQPNDPDPHPSRKENEFFHPSPSATHTAQNPTPHSPSPSKSLAPTLYPIRTTAASRDHHDNQEGEPHNLQASHQTSQHFPNHNYRLTSSLLPTACFLSIYL